MKRVFIVHGWSGNPEEGWFPWLKKELSAEGFDVAVPAMPDPDEPRIGDWVDGLKNAVGKSDEDTFFVGHSIGCQAVLRYFETPAAAKAGGAVFVAGWFRLTNAETDEEKRIGKPWLETPIDFSKVRSRIGKMTAIFSDDDPVVPLESNSADFRDKLGAQIVIESKKGHFSGSDGITELPSVLEAVMAMSSKE